MRLIYCILTLCLLIGCSSEHINFGINTSSRPDAIRTKFRQSPTNKYFIAIEGRNSVFNGGSCGVDELDEKSEKILDSFVESDISQTTALALSKGYDIYCETSDGSLEALLDKIVKVSNDRTQLMLVMSGECDDKGFNINLVHTGCANVVPPARDSSLGKS